MFGVSVVVSRLATSGVGRSCFRWASGVAWAQAACTSRRRPREHGIPGSFAVGDLRRNPVRLRELAVFMLSREGFFPYFYCDDNGFVTIGIGTLVAREDDARRHARDPNVRFTFHNAPQRRATVDEVAADWQRVH